MNKHKIDIYNVAIIEFIFRFLLVFGLKESCRSIGNNLVVAGVVSAFFSQVPLVASFIVMVIGVTLVGYGVKK